MKFSAPNKENHYALWMWLHRNPVIHEGRLTEKDDWPGFATMERLGIQLPDGYCFACEECFCDCSRCPITPQGSARCANGLYAWWVDEYRPTDRAKYAKMIAEAWK